MLLEDPSQLDDFVAEFLALSRRRFQFGQELAGLLVVVERFAHEILRLLVLSKNGEEVLFFEISQQLKLVPKLSEQLKD
jgi:hypothetical protein